MAGLNTAQIIDIAKSRGINISSGEAQSILDQAWDQSQYGADRGRVESLLGSAGNSSGSSSSSYSLPDIQIPSVEEYIQGIVDTMPEAPQKYSEVNPFAFDEENAKALASAEFGPYYDELLADYLGDVETTMQRTGDDKQRAVVELESQEDYFKETNQKSLDQLLQGIKEGYSNKGLYFSGDRRQKESWAEESSQGQLDDYLRRTGYQKSGITTDAQRTLEDLSKQSGRYQRDLGREKQGAITENVLQQRGEAVDQYLTGMQTYYQTPNWGAS